LADQLYFHHLVTTKKTPKIMIFNKPIRKLSLSMLETIALSIPVVLPLVCFLQNAGNSTFTSAKNLYLQKSSATKNWSHN
jgi:abortive infection bacteriophage resistance protein